MAEIRWTEAAAADLESIAAFISLDSPHYSHLFVLDILRAVEKLSTFPNLGRIVPEKNDPAIREIILGTYRIVYRFKYESPEILAIHHGARLLELND